MQYAFYNRYMFIDQNVLNTEQTEIATSFALIGAAFRTSGLSSPSSITLTPSALVVTATLTLPFGVQFSSGVYAQGHGTTNGVDTQTYSLNFASNVPASGSVTVYVVAQASQVFETSIEVVGPPPGHTDYDPTFTPAAAYTLLYDTLNLVITTTPPNNTTNVEIFRTTLTAGQTGITAGQLVTTNQVLAGNFVTFSNVTTGLGYTPVNKAGDTMSGQLSLTAALSGSATSSPNLQFQAWTGSAAVSHTFNESSASVLQIQNSTNGSRWELDQSSNQFLISAFSGAALSSPKLILQAWTGSAGLRNTIQVSTGGVFIVADNSGITKFQSDNSYNFTVGGGLFSLFNTLDNGSNGAAIFANNVSVAGTLAVTGAVTFSSTLNVSGNVAFGGSLITIKNTLDNGSGASTFLGNMVIQTTQSGGASNSPNLSLKAWTGSAGTQYTLLATSGALFQILNNAGNAEVQMDSSGQFTFNPQSVASHVSNYLLAQNSFAEIKFPGVAGSTDTNDIYWLRNNSTSLAFAVQVGTAGSFNAFIVKSNKVVSTFFNTLDDGSGNMIVQGSGNFNTSTLRIKDNVRPLALDVNKFMRIGSIAYDHKVTHAPCFGFAAEDIFDIYPELVLLDEEHKPNALNYVGILPHAVLMIQEHQRQIASLKTRIAELEANGVLQ